MTIAQLIDELMIQANRDPKMAAGMEVVDEKSYPIEFVDTTRPHMTVRIAARRMKQ